MSAEKKKEIFRKIALAVLMGICIATQTASSAIM